MKELAGFSDIIGKDGIFIDGDWVESKDQDPNGEVRLVQLADIGDGVFLNKSSRFLTIEKAQELKCTFLKPGDILIARMPEPLGRACVFPGLDQPAVTVVDICIIRPDSNLAHPDWLKALINSKKFRSDIHRKITGTTRLRISRGNLSTLRFNLPSLSDQIKIATLLKKTEDLIQKRKESIDLLDELVRSTFLEMFGDPVRNEKYWKIMNIDQFASRSKNSIKRGPFGGALKKEIFVDQGYLVYEQYHALNDDFSFERYFINEKKFKELEHFKVLPKDIIISCSGIYLGKLAIIPEGAKEGIINQALLKITLDENIMMNEVFVHIFRSDSFRTKFFGSLRGSGIPNFPPMAEFRKFDFIVPPIDLQKKFDKIVSKIRQIKECFLISYNELVDLYNSLSQRAFNGELDLSKVEIDHLLPKEAATSDNLDLIPTVANNTLKKLSSLEEEQAFIQQRKSEMYDFTDLMADAVGAGKKGKQKLRNKLDAFFTGAQISKIILDHFSEVHFTAEMLQHFLNTQKLATVQYTGNKELRENPKIDLVQDIPRILEQVLHVTDPQMQQDKNMLKLEQVFYNGLKPDFELQIREEDRTFTANKTPEQLSGIYFKVKA